MQDGPRHNPLQALDAGARRMLCRRGHRIHHTGTARGGGPDLWCQVAAGIVGRCRCGREGQRQIVAFVFPGELLVLSPESPNDSWGEIVCDDTVVIRYPSHAIEALLARDVRVAEAVRRLTFDSLRRMERHLLSIGQMNAVERVSYFLLELADRLPAARPGAIAVPMTRRDMADHLALSDETVSRAFCALRERAAIALPTPHDVRIIDREALVALARPCRGSRPTPCAAGRPAHSGLDTPLGLGVGAEWPASESI